MFCVFPSVPMIVNIGFCTGLECHDLLGCIFLCTGFFCLTFSLDITSPFGIDVLGEHLAITRRFLARIRQTDRGVTS
ncbi:hypothetical protein GALL_536900 [mine drainage metagenome]|uniref:Uncharacterized protein n=1 Tax=mine drainage metagenome TaxID=410659 RepID=A0A1J5PMF3_9ZZZZ